MGAYRNEAKALIIGYFCKHFQQTADKFPENLNLRSDLLFTSYSLSMLSDIINSWKWRRVRVTPDDVVDCNTIGSLIDLLDNKSSISTRSYGKLADAALLATAIATVPIGIYSIYKAINKSGVSRRLA